MKQTVSPERARRRAIVRILQKLHHALPGFVLAGHGIMALREGAHGWHIALAIAEIVTSAAVFIAFIRAVRELRDQLQDGGAPHPHFGIDWVDIFLAAMLATEAWAKWMVDGRAFRPDSLLAIVMLALGLFGGKLAKWKYEQGSDKPAVVIAARNAMNRRSKTSATPDHDH